MVDLHLVSVELADLVRRVPSIRSECKLCCHLIALFLSERNRQTSSAGRLMVTLFSMVIVGIPTSPSRLDGPFAV
jgi:hypothetical protein